MALALAANFGSVERWRDEFTRLANAPDASRVMLCFQPRDGALFNCSGDAPAQAEGVEILVVEPCANAALTSIDWAVVYQRYQDAVHDASEEFGASASEVTGATLLDVRRAGVFEQATQVIPGAQWCDPAAVGELGRKLAPGQEVVVYCVYGHEVGRATALRLRAQGLNAKFLRGGIDGWKTAGLPLADK